MTPAVANRRPWIEDLGIGLVVHRERPLACVEEVTHEVEVGGGDPEPGPRGSAAVMQVGVQRVPPDAAPDGEASEAGNRGRDLQPVVKLVLARVPAEDDAAGGSPAALDGRGDRDRVIVVV